MASVYSDFTNRVREKAVALGIDKIGFGRVEYLEKEGIDLDSWLHNGYHGTMRWMQVNAERRKNPSTMLHGAKSVISIAINYFLPSKRSDDALTFRISRHVWGQDYHAVMTSILSELWKFISEEYPEANGKIIVDAGPVMEKAWAVRSGIGWQGKNSILLTKEYGSWIFLGELICDIEFEYDSPLEELCGDCKLCLDACPTDAIVRPYVLDANKCIAYQTIENKDVCTPDIERSIGNWIYGCDICQDVCPWNKKSQRTTSNQEFHGQITEKIITPSDLKDLDEKKFHEIFNESSIRRISFDKFMKNIEIAIKNNETLQKE